MNIITFANAFLILQFINSMNLSDFLSKLDHNPKEVSFSDTMACIESNYDFTETSFKNGDIINDAGQNSGSCKLFAFAKLNELDKEKTLHCFGDYYRKDVLENPSDTNHSNIRNFMVHAWEGIAFKGTPLTEKE